MSQPMVPAASTVRRLWRGAALGLALCFPAAAAARQASPPQQPVTSTASQAAGSTASQAAGSTAPQAAANAEAAEAEQPASIFNHPDGRLWIAGQANFIYQANLPFHSPYSGPHSLQARSEERMSRVLSLYTGLRLWRGAEVLVDVESAGGRGLSDAFGVAGFTNLDVVRNPELGSQPYLARALYHQTWALGAETPETVANDRVPWSSATRAPVRRFDLWVGKLSTVDLFDQNAAGGDSHLQFLNWTVDNNGAFDYAADTRGYAYGVAGELHESRFSLRAGVETMPKVANGIDLDLRLDRARGQNVEAEVRPTLAGRDGAVRLLVYRNVADMGSYREAIAGFLSGRDPVPDITRYREQGRTKTGVGINFEQAVSTSVRVFGRWGVDDGRTESFAYTEVDGTLELGADLRLRQEKHKAGIAWVANRLSGPHRTYLELGGQGFLLGDGRLDYGQEQIVETYYNYRIWRGLYLGADLQHVTNPGYNRDRGPVWVPSSRLHIDF